MCGQLSCARDYRAYSHELVGYQGKEIPNLEFNKTYYRPNAGIVCVVRDRSRCFRRRVDVVVSPSVTDCMVLMEIYVELRGLKGESPS